MCSHLTNKTKPLPSKLEFMEVFILVEINKAREENSILKYKIIEIVSCIIILRSSPED